MVGCVVAHVPYTANFEAALVRPVDVIASQLKVGALSDLFPSLQVPNLAVLSEMLEQFNETEIRK